MSDTETDSDTDTDTNKMCTVEPMEIWISLGLCPLEPLPSIIIKPNSIDTGISLGVGLGLVQCKYTITPPLISFVYVQDANQRSSCQHVHYETCRSRNEAARRVATCFACLLTSDNSGVNYEARDDQRWSCPLAPRGGVYRPFKDPTNSYFTPTRSLFVPKKKKIALNWSCSTCSFNILWSAVCVLYVVSRCQLSSHINRVWEKRDRRARPKHLLLTDWVYSWYSWHPSISSPCSCANIAKQFEGVYSAVKILNTNNKLCPWKGEKAVMFLFLYSYHLQSRENIYHLQETRSLRAVAQPWRRIHAWWRLI